MSAILLSSSRTKEEIIFTLNPYRLFSQRTRGIYTGNRLRALARQKRELRIEALEPRTMLSESAVAQIVLASTAGTQANPVYHYNITVTDTGTTNIGTFWFAWIPGEDFLPSVPSAVSDPTGWGDTLTGSGNSADGTAIEWVASSHAITPGNSLGGFGFASTDSPATLAGNSPTHPNSPALTAFVYSGAAFSDAGFELPVTEAASTAASTTMLSSSAPTTTSGTSVTFTATVTAASGSGPTPTGTVSFTQDGNVLGPGNLQADGTATFQTSNLPVGVDHITATYSGDSNYSGSASMPFAQTITGTSTIVPSIAKSTLATAMIAGRAAFGTVTIDLTNESASAIKGNVTIAVYASTTGSIDVNSVQLALVVRPVNLLTVKPAVISVPIRIKAAELPADSYTLFARVTDPLANVVDSAAGPTVTVAAPFISLSTMLARTTFAATVKSPAVAPGAAIFTIANSGNITTPGKTTIGLYATTAGVIDGTASLINSVAPPLRIGAGKSVSVTVPLRRIPPITPGSYIIVGQVTDPQGQIFSIVVGAVTVVAFVPATPTMPAPTPGGFY